MLILNNLYAPKKHRIESTIYGAAAINPPCCIIEFSNPEDAIKNTIPKKIEIITHGKRLITNKEGFLR